MLRESPEPADGRHILEVLRDLMDIPFVTKRILQTTNIGIEVNKPCLKRHENPEIRKLSLELISRWRLMLRNEGMQAESKTPLETTEQHEQTCLLRKKKRVR